MAGQYAISADLDLRIIFRVKDKYTKVTFGEVGKHKDIYRT